MPASDRRIFEHGPKLPLPAPGAASTRSLWLPAGIVVTAGVFADFARLIEPLSFDFGRLRFLGALGAGCLVRISLAAACDP